MSRPIGVYRGAFDPVHEGHFAVMKSAIDELDLHKLVVIPKFIGQKDMAVSLEKRIEMIRLQVHNCLLNIEIKPQNIHNHRLEIESLINLTHRNVINICGSDKSEDEIKKYSKEGDIVALIERPYFPLKKTHSIAKEKNVEIRFIHPSFYSSSTFARKIIFESDFSNISSPLHKSVQEFISSNSFYQFNNSQIQQSQYKQEWTNFIHNLNKIKLFKNELISMIPMPDYNPIQHPNAWHEKFIRATIVFFNLKHTELSEFIHHTMPAWVDVG